MSGHPSGSPLSSPSLSSAPAPADRRRRPRSDAFRELRGERHYLISQDLFRDALARERKRADRFEDAFVLVLISLNSRAARQSRRANLVRALSQVTLDADVIGWFEQDTVLGLIRSLADRDSSQIATTLADAVRRQLMRSLTPDNVDGCSIRLEVYSPHGDSIPSSLFEAGDERPTWQRILRDAVKRALDIVGSGALLMACAPLFLVLATLVKLSSKGSVFFRQLRVGQSGRPFVMFKFRTMEVNADPNIHQQYVEQFIQSRAPFDSGEAVAFKIVDDPRVTPLGRFLRRSSLDELPQFWNVLKGNMSLVGPRPPLPYEVAKYKPWHRRRVFEAKPGITGLWQVTGRSRTTFDEMVRLDLRYARNYSLWTDLKILLATPRAVISGEGAH